MKAIILIFLCEVKLLYSISLEVTRLKINIPKLNESARLFDFYGSLLTDKQQQIFSLYYYDDLSLGEIAQELGISRQAVYDIIKRTEKLIKNYEQRLKLWEKHQSTEEAIKNIKVILSNSKIDDKEKQRINLCLDKFLG